MSRKTTKPIVEQSDRIQITEARKPKKKTVQADPFARIQLHPLEDLEARDHSSPEDKQPTSPLDFDTDQVEPSKTNQVEPSTSKTKTNQDRVEPSRAKTDQVEPSRAKLKSVETSPSKNYTKVPNSIAKLAIPEKYFRGLSKHTYDILYQQTRGAIVPSRTIRLTKGDLSKLTGLAMHTVKLHIKYLNESGLVVTQREVGKHTGYIYEIFVPEEIESDQVEPSPSKRDQNLTRHTDQNLVLLGHTNPVESKDTYEIPKTFLNTMSFKVDDEKGIREFLELLNSAAKDKTGKNLTAKDWSALIDIAKLLIAETNIAASRTDSISTYIPFMAENLRRRLRAKPKSENKKDVVGKTLIEPEALDEESRQILLKSYQQSLEEYGMEWVDSNKNQFTENDWKWLKENLSTN